MKIILAIILLALVGIIQYKLWADKNGIAKTHSLSQAIEIQQKQNDALKKHNDNLKADITALKQQGNTAVEDHARNDLGMIKKGEVFYQIVK